MEGGGWVAVDPDEVEELDGLVARCSRGTVIFLAITNGAQHK